MNVFRITYLLGTKPPAFVAALTLLEAMNSAGADIASGELLGPVIFAEGTEILSGGRALTEAEIKATITEDGQHLVSLEDGKKYKSLKRHLSLAGLTPDQYRAKWGLPAAYPMVSVAYSIRRRDLALAAGLGRGKKK
jgi:hypothetical protein